MSKTGFSQMQCCMCTFLRPSLPPQSNYYTSLSKFVRFTRRIASAQSMLLRDAAVSAAVRPQGAWHVCPVPTPCPRSHLSPPGPSAVPIPPRVYCPNLHCRRHLDRPTLCSTPPIASSPRLLLAAPPPALSRNWLGHACMHACTPPALVCNCECEWHTNLVLEPLARQVPTPNAAAAGRAAQ